MTKKLTILMYAYFWAMNSDAAINEKEYAKCAVINGDLSRFECLDHLAKEKNLDGRQAQPNNPFNIRQDDNIWHGSTGASDGLVTFEDAVYGTRAASKTMQGFDAGTLRDIIAQWSPGENSDTYAAAVSALSGIGEDDQVDLTSQDVISSILSPVAQVETGTSLTPDQISASVMLGDSMFPDSEQPQKNVEEPPVSQIEDARLKAVLDPHANIPEGGFPDESPEQIERTVKGRLGRPVPPDYSSYHLQAAFPTGLSLSEKGKWDVSVDVNPIDDSETVTLSLDADSGKTGGVVLCF